MSSMRGNILVVRPLTKMMFRGPGEFDMSSVGLRAYASSMLYPLPTAVASILIHHMISMGDLGEGDVNNGWGDWIKEYESIMDKLGIPSPKGPFVRLCCGDECSYYLVSDLKNKRLIKIGGEIEIPLELVVGLSPLREPLSIYMGGEGGMEYIDASAALRALIGIQLQEERKVTASERGRSVYTAEFLFPETLWSDDPLNQGCQVTLEYIYLFMDGDLPSDHFITRFGGEGGVVSVNISHEDINIDLTRWDSDWRGLYVASPLLIPTGEDTVEYIGSAITGVLDTDAKVYIVGETTLIGAGFARAIRNKPGTRRPIYKALKPGSLIYVKTDSNPPPQKTEALIKEGLGEASRIGFGSVFPFNYRYGDAQGGVM